VSHARVLGTTAWEHEDNFGLVTQHLMAEHLSRVFLLQQRGSLLSIGSHDHPTLAETAATLLECKGDVSQV
jgi:hypothetical protein